MNWEKKGVRPEVRVMPKVISYLGYNPELDSESLAERIRAAR